MKKVLISLTTFVLFLSGVHFLSIQAENAEVDETFEVGETLPSDHVYTTMDENGNIVEFDVETLEEETQKEVAEYERLKQSGNIGNAKAITNGVVNFKTKSSANYNTNYTEDATNRSGYTNGYYAADGAFLGYSSDGKKVKFMQAGVIGWVNASEVQVLDYDSDQVKSVNFYRAENGRVRHYGTNNISSQYYFLTTDIGPKPSYMGNNVVYYSYDGHYFYTTYAAMIKDYKAGVRTGSINPNNPYYNYYQYLPHRSKTSVSASVFNSLTSNRGGANSKMANLGSSFIANQNAYGVNAMLMYGVAANESAWGTSGIAHDKNNLFGHGAVDSNPYWGANGYASASDSIKYHAKVFISEGYCDPLDYSGRYFGSHLGDKASGINVKYASDPYWGEKAAAIAWQLDANAGGTDHNTYEIAIKEKGTNLNVRKESTSSSTLLYQTGTAGHYPFIILGEVTGQNVNGSTKWYKIQSDPTLNSDRTAIVQDKGEYNFSNFYGYIHSSYVDVISDNTSGEVTPPPTPSYKKGDVNGDGKITPTDYVLVKNHIMGTKKLIGNGLTSADYNGDGKITATDYVLIKNVIMQ